MGCILAPNVMPTIPARISGNCRFIAEGSLTSLDEECRMYGVCVCARTCTREEGGRDGEGKRGEKKGGDARGKQRERERRKSETEKEREIEK